MIPCGFGDEVEPRSSASKEPGQVMRGRAVSRVICSTGPRALSVVVDAGVCSPSAEILHGVGLAMSFHKVFIYI